MLNNRKNISTILGLSLILTGTAMASVPNTPGPYVGVYQVTDTSAHISFLDNSTDEDGFKVYINDANNVFDATVVPNPILVPKHDTADLYQYANITGLTPNTLYKLAITAYNSDGESTPTLSTSQNNGRLRTSPPVCKPLMPGEYVGTYNITDTSARISFKDNSNNEDGFKVYLYNYNSGVLLKTLTLPSVAGVGGYQYKTITGLTPNTLYRVAVTAFASGCGESNPTHSSSVTNGRFRTTDSTPPPPPQSCPLKPSEYVGTYDITDTSARISFVDNANNETGFKAYVYKYGTSTLLQTVNIPAKSGVGQYQYTNITNLTPNTVYGVKVSAFNASCESNTTTPSSINNGRFRTQP